MRSFSDEFKVGVLLIASCLVGLCALYYFHYTPVHPFAGFPALVLGAALLLSTVLTPWALRRTMQDADYNRPVDPDIGPDVKKKS